MANRYRRRFAGLPSLVRVEQHQLGPRVFILGMRVHEVLIGLVLLGVTTVLWFGRWAPPPVVIALGLFSGWLIAKDWRDVFPSLRDTAGWRLGIHRRIRPLRPRRPGDAVASAAAFLTFLVATVNVVSALTPNDAWRTKLLVQFEPVSAVPVFHALAVPFAVILGVIAVNLANRRRRALDAAVIVLAVVGILDLLKGLDLEEAMLSWGAAGLLWWKRDAFHVAHEPVDVRRLLRGPGTLVAGVIIGTVGVIWLSIPNVDLAFSVRGALDLLAWRPVPGNGGNIDGLTLSVRLAGVAALLAASVAVFKPREVTRRAVDPATRLVAHELVRAHGRDTLAFFKLRRDTDHFFSADRRAFLAYRIENGVLLISGDPVGHPSAFPGLLEAVCAFADLRGLRVGAVGVCAELLPLYEHAGLQSLYIGDEAIVDTRTFTLEGRAIRKVRQSVNRLEAARYTVTLERGGQLDAGTRAALDRISVAWRGTAPERGFSMAMDSVVDEHHDDTVLLIARDAGGEARGFLHFVPTYGRNAMSLSQMRRDPDTPNGLTEFLVVRSIALLGASGVDEISLNFSAFARLIRRPSGRIERILGRVVSIGNPFFQIESLYRFNAKFSPRWVPRYLLYDGGLSLPRVGLAVLRAEGQLPRLRGLAERS